MVRVRRCTMALHAAPGNPMLMQALVGLELKAGGTQAALAAATTLAADPTMQPAARALPGDIWEAVGDQSRAAARVSFGLQDQSFDGAGDSCSGRDGPRRPVARR